MKNKRSSRRVNFTSSRTLIPHPTDSKGVPVIPKEISLECNPRECRYRKPHKDRQHVMHPAFEYQTALERQYRNLGCFVITMCRCQHENWDRLYTPPKKIRPEIMRRVIEEYNRGEFKMERQGQLFKTEEYTNNFVPDEFQQEYQDLTLRLKVASNDLAEANQRYHQVISERIEFVERLRNAHQVEI